MEVDAGRIPGDPAARGSKNDGLPGNCRRNGGYPLAVRFSLVLCSFRAEGNEGDSCPVARGLVSVLTLRRSKEGLYGNY